MSSPRTIVGGAQEESAGFLSYFDALPDPRQRGKVIYPLNEVLLLSLLATLAGAETFVDIALFGVQKRELLRRFLPFAAGTPSHDHLGDLFAVLDAECFQRCFASWVGSLTGRPEGVVAIDGKTSRRTKSAGQAALHTVSAFSARQRLILAQTKVAEKSNEITAIPKLLEMLVLEGAIVTLDAMGCQRQIAQAILDKKADYVLALKGNQGTLREDVELFVQTGKARDFAGIKLSRERSVDGDHGRIETRLTTVIHEVDWLSQRHAWPGLKSLVIVDSTRELGDRIEQETRYYLSSMDASADKQATIVRDHWAVENRLHWVLDMVFRDDECRVRTAHAPANLMTIKHIALNLLRQATNKHSIRARRKLAAWNDDFLYSIIASG